MELIVDLVPGDPLQLFRVIEAPWARPAVPRGLPRPKFPAEDLRFLLLDTFLLPGPDPGSSHSLPAGYLDLPRRLH